MEISSADTGDGEENMISHGKCISYLVALLEARQATVQRETRRTAHQDAMNLTTFSRALNEPWRSSLCARCLVYREQLYLYTPYAYSYRPFKRMLFDIK